MRKEFWSKSSVAVIGGGSWGTVLAKLAAQNCEQVRLWVRDEDQARAMNSTRSNPTYVKEMTIPENVRTFTDIERVFDQGVQAIIWALPASACRETARRFAPLFHGDEMVLHATKGVEEGSMKRISVILAEELPLARIGVLSGPNLATEIARDEPAATVVASDFLEVVEAGMSLFNTPRFRVYAGDDVIGVEWAGTLKNIYAIAAGALDALEFGWNARALLLTRGLAEMVRFGVAMGAKESTFLGLGGAGDLFATCSSPLSRNYRVGQRLARGEALDPILSELGAVAEGVRTAQIISAFAVERKIPMPITQGVFELIRGTTPVNDVLRMLMQRPVGYDASAELGEFASRRRT
ncbi:MAG: NAD(P)-dependent glycerol-3-phosphate dehydrogenase [Cryobacterium sp.]|nr:NAD(P)-dependent glycerol-3-phosphate dehydrogenase [Oligoflexia bacterium]